MQDTSRRPPHGADGTRRRMMIAAGAALAGAWQGRGQAAAPRRKNLNIVVGFPAGGPADSAARMMAEAMRGDYAGTVIVDNRPGAAGRIAVEYVKNAEPDGSTVLLVPGTQMTMNPHVYRHLSYDPQRDFTPVALACNFDLALAVGPSVPASVRTIDDFVRWGKAHPEELFFGAGAQGSLTHYLGILFAKATGIEFMYVPYKGGPEVMRDLLGGRLAATFTVLSEAVPNMKSGRLRVLGIPGSKRSYLAPGVPTLKEAGIGIESTGWFGFYVSSRTPADTVRALADAIGAAQRNPAVVKGFADIGYEVLPGTPASFAAMAGADFEKWGPIVKEAGFTLD